MTRPVYLDHNATTPVAPEVAEAIRPFLNETFGTRRRRMCMGNKQRKPCSAQGGKSRR